MVLLKIEAMLKKKRKEKEIEKKRKRKEKKRTRGGRGDQNGASNRIRCPHLK